MPKPDYDYRINPDRAIYIVGDFDEDLLKVVIPRITELRFGSEKPISIVISSYGGSTDCLGAIKSALCVLGPDGSQSRVITLVTGHAASAGATLLTLGDYAIATPSSWLHFHGIRMSTDEAIRMEDASQIAHRLAGDNRRIAQHLANVMIGRVMHRFTRLKPADALSPPKVKLPPLIDRYVSLAMEKTTQAADQILVQALRKLSTAKELSSEVAKLRLDPNNRGLNDVKILAKIILKQKRQSKNPKWRLTEYSLGHAYSEYFLLRDYGLGRQLERVINLYGVEFLDAIAFKKYKSIRSVAKRKAFLTNEVQEHIRDFWYFTTAVAEQLLYGENRLTAKDAYWLGVIDEIQGDPNHYGLRELVEKRTRRKKP